MAIGALLLIVVGSALVTAAIGLQSAFGWQGSVVTDLGTVVVPPGVRALVMDVDGVSLDTGWPLPGRTVLTATSPGGPVTMLVGERRDVDVYLAGVPFAVAHRSGDEWRVAAVPGAATPADWRRTTWRAAQSGAAPEVPIAAPTTVLVTSPDGAVLHDVSLTLGWRIADPRVPILAYGVAGVLMVLSGFALVGATVVVRFPRD